MERNYFSPLVDQDIKQNKKLLQIFDWSKYSFNKWAGYLAKGL